jgi:hypothetical protein
MNIVGRGKESSRTMPGTTSTSAAGEPHGTRTSSGQRHLSVAAGERTVGPMTTRPSPIPTRALLLVERAVLAVAVAAPLAVGLGVAAGRLSAPGATLMSDTRFRD